MPTPYGRKHAPQRAVSLTFAFDAALAAESERTQTPTSALLRQAWEEYVEAHNVPVDHSITGPTES